MDDILREHLWNGSLNLCSFLAMISNAAGAFLVFGRLFNFPWSMIVTLLYTKLYRIFLINDPIFSDFEIAFLLLVAYAFAETDWKVALATYIMCIIFCYNSVLVLSVIRYIRRQETQRRFGPRAILPSLLSRIIGVLANCQPYVLNTAIFILAWNFPSDNEYYSFFQDYVVWFLIMESILYLSCYKLLRLRMSQRRRRR